MAERAHKDMTVSEFYAWQLDQTERYELVDGMPVKMMTGASNFHDTITSNVIISLGYQLRGSKCRVTTPDTALQTRIKTTRRPDVTVTCEPPDANSYEAKAARLVVEVLSPSNAGVAWERKLDEYRRLDGLIYMLLIDSRELSATLYTRAPSGAWDASFADERSAVLNMPEINCCLRMSDVYDRLDFEGHSAA